MADGYLETASTTLASCTTGIVSLNRAVARIVMLSLAPIVACGDTLIVSYDPGRGEPRGNNAKRGRKGEASGHALGDCIDCGLCVQVCPTGIDIRNGLQLDCIGCAACVDACPNEAISQGDDAYVIDEEKCTECKGEFDAPHCVEVCPIEGCIVAAA